MALVVHKDKERTPRDPEQPGTVVSVMDYSTNSTMDRKRNTKVRGTKALRQNPSKRDNNLLLRPAFKGQPVGQFVVISVPSLLVTTVTTGTIATVLSIDPVSSVSNWATRFGATWREYRVVKSVIKIRCFGSTNSGLFNVYPDESNSGAPTNVTAEQQKSMRFAAADINKDHVMKWKPHSLTDLGYLPIATSSVQAYWKIYTDNANYGSPIAVTTLGVANVDMTVQLREFI